MLSGVNPSFCMAYSNMESIAWRSCWGNGTPWILKTKQQYESHWCKSYTRVVFCYYSTFFKHKDEISYIFSILLSLQLTNRLSDHLKWCFIQQTEANNVLSCNVQSHLGQSEYWICCVAMATRTCKAWCSVLSRFFFRASDIISSVLFIC